MMMMTMVKMLAMVISLIHYLAPDPLQIGGTRKDIIKPLLLLSPICIHDLNSLQGAVV